jgi:hypothetical protein
VIDEHEDPRALDRVARDRSDASLPAIDGSRSSTIVSDHSRELGISMHGRQDDLMPAPPSSVGER